MVAVCKYLFNKCVTGEELDISCISSGTVWAEEGRFSLIQGKRFVSISLMEGTGF